jgi:hypothetical protein
MIHAMQWRKEQRICKENQIDNVNVIKYDEMHYEVEWQQSIQ